MASRDLLLALRQADAPLGPDEIAAAVPSAPHPRAGRDRALLQDPRDAVVLPSPRLDVDSLVRRTEALLAAGIPLSLLLDLADPDGPHSEELYAEEG